MQKILISVDGRKTDRVFMRTWSLSTMSSPALSSAMLSTLFSMIAINSVAAQESNETQLEEVEVYITGSRIKGASETGLVPASVLTSEDLEAFGAESTGDLLGNLAQAGSFEFSESADGPNDARGDIATVNLRGLGSGNTLVMLNGRRLVLHPFTQDIDRTPRAVVNVNTIPSQAIGRTEILKDGASALYGADATAGVVNAILKSDYEGFRISYRQSQGESIQLKSESFNFSGGFDFNGGRSHINIFGSYYSKNGIFSRELKYSASVDHRNLLPADWIYANGQQDAGNDPGPDTDFRNLDRISDWGQFRAGNLINGVFDVSSAVGELSGLISSPSGIFHIQPLSTDGPVAGLASGVNIDTGTLDRSLRYNTNLRRQLSPAIDRGNLFMTLDHEFDNGLEFFGELSYYQSDSHSQRSTQPIDQGLALQVVPASNFWNPFGTAFINGQPNLNRADSLTTADLVDGADILIDRWRPTEIGPRLIETKASTYRILGGLKGIWGNWDWESAIFYNRADAEDSTGNLISKTLLQQQLALDTPDAINPFGGPMFNSEEQMARIRTSITNDASTTLSSWDLRASRSDLFVLPWAADDAGVALGIEWRNEDYEDDRDAQLDGTIRYFTGSEGGTDSSTAIGSDVSDVAGISPTADSRASRNVYSLFAEMLIPLVSDKPFAKRIDFQIAGRFEALDDTKEEIFKPKYALSWRPIDVMTFRTSYSEGFRAPNLVQLFRGDVTRLNRDLVDWWRAAAGATDSSDNSYRRVVRESNAELKSEDTTTSVFGVQFDIPILDGGTLLLSADRWRFKQENVIETFGGAEQLALDYLLRQQGSFNPLVVREAPTTNDITTFQSALGFNASDAVGRVSYIRDPYINLQPRTVEGIDFAVRVTLPHTSVGRFAIQAEASKLLRFDQPNDTVAEIFDEQIVIDALTNNDAGDLQSFSTSRIKLNDKPEWRSSGSVNWRNGDWGAAWSFNYVSEMVDTDAINDITGEFWTVKSWFTHNAHVDYRFDFQKTKMRVRLGVVNLENKAPPLAENARGYFTTFHNNRGRQWSASARMDF